MASVSYAKRGGKGRTPTWSQLRHCAPDTRKKTEHSNREIDKSKTDLNLSFKAHSYEEALTKYNDRLKAVMEEQEKQTGRKVRKDAVHCFELNIPRPRFMFDADEITNWFTDVMETIEEKYGSDNVVCGFAHFDEVHEYRNSSTGYTSVSREHLQVFVVPEINGRLNGKQFSSRANMIDLNERIHQMTEERYDYEFMDGSKRKSTKTVEELKQSSRFLEVERELEALEKSLNRKEAENKSIRQALGKEAVSLNEREKGLRRRELNLGAREKEVNARESHQAAVERRLVAREGKVSLDEEKLLKRDSELSEGLLQVQRLRDELDALFSQMQDLVRKGVLKEQALENTNRRLELCDRRLGNITRAIEIERRRQQQLDDGQFH